MRSKAGWFVVLGVLSGAMTVPALAAQASAAEVSPTIACDVERHSNEIVEKVAKLLSPADGATVVAGTPVTFSAESGVESPMTFMVASSPALLSSPDVGSGLGVSQPLAQYTFTSTEVAAAPRTIYWTASFTRTLHNCEESAVTFTLPARALTILPSPTEEAATNRKHEEAGEPAGSVSLDGAIIKVQSTRKVVVKLACTGMSACKGKLTMTTTSTKSDDALRGKKASSATTTIGSARFLIPAGKTAGVRITLNTTGRALLKADHRRLNTKLTIRASSPASTQTHTETVQLLRQKAAKAKKH